MGHQGTASPRAIVALPASSGARLPSGWAHLSGSAGAAGEPLAGDRVAKQPPAMGLSMQHKLLHDSNGQRTYVVVLDKGEEVLGALEAFARMQRIHTAQLTAIGAFSDVVLKYFDWDSKAYHSISVPEQVEVASLNGDIAQSPTGEPHLHVHLVVGKRDGTAMAGHLGAAHVRPTLEVIVTESPAHLRKVKDAETGLALIRPVAS